MSNRDLTDPKGSGSRLRLLYASGDIGAVDIPGISNVNIDPNSFPNINPNQTPEGDSGDV